MPHVWTTMAEVSSESVSDSMRQWVPPYSAAESRAGSRASAFTAVTVSVPMGKPPALATRLISPRYVRTHVLAIWFDGWSDERGSHRSDCTPPQANRAPNRM